MCTPRNFAVRIAIVTACFVPCLALDAFAQLGGRNDNAQATAGADLQLDAPQVDVPTVRNRPAPATPINTASAGAATAPQAPKTSDIEHSITSGAQPIVDPERQSVLRTTGESATANKIPADQTPRINLDAPGHANSQTALPAGASQLEQRIVRLERLIEAQSNLLQEIANSQKYFPSADELRLIREELVALRSSFQNVARPALDPPGSLNRQTNQPIYGMLVIENLTSVGYTMNINGYQFTIMPGRREFRVPVGNVDTEIAGYEPVKRWSASDWRQNGDKQQLAIQIR